MYRGESRVEIKHYITGGEMYGWQSRVEIKHSIYITGGENVWVTVTGRNQTLLKERMYGGSHR